MSMALHLNFRIESLVLKSIPPQKEKQICLTLLSFASTSCCTFSMCSGWAARQKSVKDKVVATVSYPANKNKNALDAISSSVRPETPH